MQSRGGADCAAVVQMFGVEGYSVALVSSDRGMRYCDNRLLDSKPERTNAWKYVVEGGRWWVGMDFSLFASSGCTSFACTKDEVGTLDGVAGREVGTVYAGLLWQPPPRVARHSFPATPRRPISAPLASFQRNCVGGSYCSCISCPSESMALIKDTCNTASLDLRVSSLFVRCVRGSEKVLKGWQSPFIAFWRVAAGSPRSRPTAILCPAWRHCCGYESWCKAWWALTMKVHLVPYRALCLQQNDGSNYQYLGRLGITLTAQHTVSQQNVSLYTEYIKSSDIVLDRTLQGCQLLSTSVLAPRCNLQAKVRA